MSADKDKDPKTDKVLIVYDASKIWAGESKLADDEQVASKELEALKLVQKIWKTGADSIKHPKPVPRPIIDGLAREGELVCYSAPSKVAKTWALMQMAIAFVQGSSFLGFRFEQENVLYLNFELFEGIFDQRLADLLEGQPNVRLSCFKNYMRTLHFRGKRLSTTNIFYAIEKQIIDTGFKPTVIFLDPFYRVLEGKDENSNSDIADLLLGMIQIADRLQAALIYADHHAKGDRSDLPTVDQVAGAGAKGRAFDCSINQVRVLPLDADKNIYRINTTSRSFAPAKPRYVGPDDKGLGLRVYSADEVKRARKEYIIQKELAKRETKEMKEEIKKEMKEKYGVEVKDTTALDEGVEAIVYFLEDSTKECLSNKELGELTGWSKRKLYDCLREAKARDLIEVVSASPGKPTIWQLKTH